ncbi:hypothetical protein [Metabacillus niabensis]|uniref:Uncharacterized protein n=1 Tax=Metabacillus niabensis TaxID=324854 RepID=A0ABT9YZS3_9BACI|nr:hypothetical protein [Metabacillus niabensis]MDQ0225229.1 hypothetical protein [Metabacillus niabensis]PAD68155.1 hypothetical protein CHH83_15285 [Bacillus sp. 7586-K]
MNKRFQMSIEENKLSRAFLKFIDGDGFDRFLNKIIQGLFFIIVGFGVPYFIYVLISCLF